MKHRPVFYLRLRFPYPAVCDKIGAARFKVVVGNITFGTIDIVEKGGKVAQQTCFGRKDKHPRVIHQNRIRVDASRMTEGEFYDAVALYMFLQHKIPTSDISFSWEDDEKPIFKATLKDDYMIIACHR